jgi:hypothetical protein
MIDMAYRVNFQACSRMDYKVFVKAPEKGRDGA